MTVLYSQNFDSETVGTLPAGWVNKVGTWQVAASGSVSGANALMSSTNGAYDALLYTGQSPIANMTVQTMGKAVYTGTKYPQIGHVLRASEDYASAYVVLAGSINGTTCSILFFRRSAGTFPLLAQYTGFSLDVTAGDTIGFETQIEGNLMSARIWNATTGSRPATPTVTRTDSVVSAAGYPGLYNNKDGQTIQLYADDFSFGNLLSDTAATQITVSGPASGGVGAASTDFTVGADGDITGTITVTPSDGGAGGSFSPTSVSISAANPTRTFTYTPASAGIKTVSVTNNGGLANSSPISFTAMAYVYTRADGTDPMTGQAVMVLVPSEFAAKPYDAGTPTNVILYSHGATETESAMLNEAVKRTCVEALLNAGYILAGTAAHGPHNWGNQASVDDYAALELYVRQHYNVDRVAIWGQSMGGLDALSAVAQGKVSPVGVLLTYPVCSLQAAYVNFMPQINTAYGITGAGIYTYANQTHGMDPALKTASAYRNVPMRFYASPDDTTVLKSANTDVLSAIVSSSRAECDVIVCSGGHGHNSHFVPAEYVAFFDRCFRSRSNTVAITLRDESGSPMPSLSGIRWIVRHRAALGKSMPPIAQGTGETTDASGVLSLTFTAALSVGDVVDLEITTSDGSPTQSPSPRGWSGPVEVA